MHRKEKKMPRPRKHRRIEFIPDITEFAIKGKGKIKQTIKLSLEELEVIRLIDLEELDQEQGAFSMGVSRGTLQRILNSARNKIANFLVNGSNMIVESGEENIRECLYLCKSCNSVYSMDDKNNNQNIQMCPNCNSLEYACNIDKKFCKENCKRYRGGRP